MIVSIMTEHMILVVSKKINLLSKDMRFGLVIQ
jgi:hypothetical protein